MEDIKRKIRETEQSFRRLFSVKKEFSKNLDKWEDLELYDMHDFNPFVPKQDDGDTELELGFADFEEVVKYQKDHGWDFVKFDSRRPIEAELEKKLVTAFSLEGWETVTMYLPKRHPENWKRNDKVEIKDIQKEDIGQALEEIELANYGNETNQDFTKRKIAHYITKAKEHDTFHYLGVFLDGKIVGAGYAFVKDGIIQIDNLIVNEEMRRQYVATTLIAYIAEHFEGILYLHADPEDTPIQMYQKMGFEVIDSVNEYLAMLK